MSRDLNLKTSCGTTVTLAYELPDSVRFDCFVPGVGICAGYVDPRAEEISVVDLTSGEPCPTTLPLDMHRMDAVLEQAGDVCRMLQLVLESQVRHGHRADEDGRTLTAIADMAMHESDAHTSWLRLPDNLRWSAHEPAFGKDDTAHKILAAFIEEVLVERAQDMSTAAAKQRQAQWETEQDARCEHCDGSGEGRCGGRCPVCGGKGRPTARLTGFAAEGL